MHELLDKIAGLPDIKLNAQQIKFIGTQFKTTPKLNGSDLQKILHIEPALMTDTATIEQAKLYFDALSELVSMLETWKIILDTTFKAHSTEALNSDLLLPLIIAMLPDNYNFRRVLSQFALLGQLATENEYSFLLTTLNIALEYKANGADKRQQETQEDQLLAPIVHELTERNVEFNVKLHFVNIKQKIINTCENTQLAIKKELMLMLPSDPIYYREGRLIEDKEKIVLALIAEALTGNITFIGNREILRLLQCYDALDVLCFFAKNCSDEMDRWLMQFSVQLNHFNAQLAPNKCESSLLVKLNYFTHKKIPFDPFHQLALLLLTEAKLQNETSLQPSGLKLG